MKRRLALGMLSLVCLVEAAEFLPALALAPIEVAKAPAVSALVDRLNAAMRERHEVPLFLRVYQEISLGGQPVPRGFALCPSDSFAGLVANWRKLEGDGALESLRTEWQALAGGVPVTQVKAVRFDGTNAPGWLLNTWVRANNEAALLAWVAAWVDGAGEIKVNVFRVMSGAGKATHLVSANAASEEQLARFMDEVSASPSWPAGVERVDGAIYREVGP
jgi:hypothetical protein